jgi:drug/metabolite transporter (DMT)-like permease
MNWLLFALLAPAVYTIVNFTDKYLVEREVPDPRGMVIFTAILSVVSGTLFWVLAGFPIPKPTDALLMMGIGMLIVVAAYFYFAAMTREAASSVIVFLQMTPIAVLVLSFLFLGEKLSGDVLLGFALILGAAVGVSLQQTGGRFKLSPAFFFALVTVVGDSSGKVLFKFVSDDLPFLQIVSFESWGVAFGGLVLYLASPTVRGAFHHNLRTMHKRGFAAVALNETFYVTAKTLSFLAISLGSATLTTVLGGTGVFYGILLGWGLTLLYPLTFKEDISRANLLRKGVLAAVLFVGIILVN